MIMLARGIKYMTILQPQMLLALSLRKKQRKKFFLWEQHLIQII